MSISSRSMSLRLLTSTRSISYRSSCGSLGRSWRNLFSVLRASSGFIAGQLEGGVKVGQGAVKILRQATAAAQQIEQGHLGVATGALVPGQRPEQHLGLGPLAAVDQLLGLDQNCLHVRLTDRTTPG